MTFTLDLDTVLSNITTIASGITGIRRAYNYDEWPDSPPAMFNKEQALHLTGFSELESTYTIGPGSGLSTYEIIVPLYTVVCSGAQLKRAANWLAPYVGRYPEKFRANLSLSGAITAGAATFDGQPVRVVRSISADWPGYDGFVILAHRLRVVTKGAHLNAL